MNRREFLKAAAAATASAALPGCGQGGPGRALPGPNVVLVLADQLRADAVGVYGETNVPTPHMDGVAAAGKTFENGLSTAPVCTPYRGMLMTGRYPTHSGVVLNRVQVSPEQNPDSLGVVFSRAGWHTGYLGKWHLAAGEARGRGLFPEDAKARREWTRTGEVEFVPPGPRRLGFAHWEAYNYHADSKRYWFYRDEPEKIFADGYETDVLADQAIAYLQQRLRDGRRFLLVVSPHPPHPPFAPEHCPTGYLEQVPEVLHFRENVPADSRVRRQPLPARCYYAMIRSLDDAVGRIVRSLDETGLSETTLLVVTSDHGEMLWSRDLTGKQLPYRESVAVPLLARWPGVVPAGARDETLFTPIDWLPTLCGMAGIAAPAGIDGRDLSGVLRGGPPGAGDAALLMNLVPGHRSFRTPGADSGLRSVPEWRGVRTRRFTFVRWRTGEEELYDDREDPYQLRNLAGSPAQASALAELRAQLHELMAAAHDEFLPGLAYKEWFDPQRNLLRTALGPVPSA